jgi:ubiquinone/menaquinone biosynthesis C-methylase UbiE
MAIANTNLDSSMSALASQAIDATTDLWESYSGVYRLMADAPFVRELRMRHVNAMAELHVILDGGCGVGLISAELARSNPPMIIALDASPPMLTKASEVLGQTNNSAFLRGDVHQLPFPDETFNGTISNNVLYCVSDPVLVIDEIVRVIKPSGIISIASPRWCLNVDILLNALSLFLKTTGTMVSDRDFELFTESNRVLRRNMRNGFEPQELSGLLTRAGCTRIIEESIAYMDQDSFVIAQK